VNKFGQNHLNIEDDWYGDYFIPKNTVIMINWWALHYDPEWYSEPEKVPPAACVSASPIAWSIADL
jgi:hypothetical protein